VEVVRSDKVWLFGSLRCLYILEFSLRRYSVVPARSDALGRPSPVELVMVEYPGDDANAVERSRGRHGTARSAII
jgi:hypothetical protein